ncbi:hypothetical protein HaLaN_27445 [Haematococcus lacustris]|uniref:Uncharacterized protein n=1 Tax=Haematococcus lacustris TaxID=44745 RepID=A0A6A0A8L0_HAELA|nr:hypothetical protein HaLaN_27445 [Haematococcus lacustris]
MPSCLLADDPLHGHEGAHRPDGDHATKAGGNAGQPGKVEGMIEGIHGIMKHKSEEEARARQGVQAPLQASSGTQWTPAGYRPLPLRVFQLGEEKEFQAAVMEDGCAVTVVGDATMPSDQELWALLTLAMHYANVIFKQFATLKDGSMHVVKRKKGNVRVCSRDAHATSYCNSSYVHKVTST